VRRKSIRPVTVVETASFERSAAMLMDEAEIAALIDHPARQPQEGDVIPDTGGIRKLRWGLSGRGKRGGARIIYYYCDERIPLYLLVAYSKSAAKDIRPADKRRMTATVETILKRHGL
jgi:hypothetical protein